MPQDELLGGGSLSAPTLVPTCRCKLSWVSSPVPAEPVNGAPCKSKSLTKVLYKILGNELLSWGGINHAELGQAGCDFKPLKWAV